MRRLFLRQGQRSGSFDHVLWQFAAAAGEDDHGVPRSVRCAAREIPRKPLPPAITIFRGGEELVTMG